MADLLHVNIYKDPTIEEMLNLFPIEKEIDAFLLDKLIDLQGTAVSALQSAVPFKTGQLQTQIKPQPEGPLSFSVYVTDSPHTASNRPDPYTASQLALLLDEGTHEFTNKPMARRKNSVPAFNKFASFPAIAKGDPTKNWIDDGISFFEKSIDEVVNSG